MKVADIYASGILSRDEQVSNFYQGTEYVDQQRLDGVIILTTSRFLFVKKPPGLFSKGFDVILSAQLNKILSVSTTGLIFKKLRISLQTSQEVALHVFSCENIKDLVGTILFNKNIYLTGNNSTAVEIITEADQHNNEISVTPKQFLR